MTQPKSASTELAFGYGQCRDSCKLWLQSDYVGLQIRRAGYAIRE